MKVAMLGWEFPPFMAGGLGVHCLEITHELARLGVEIDFYMPSMPSVAGPVRVADHHDHLNVIEVPADAPMSPYEGPGRYERDFNEAVARYNRRLVDAFDSHDADVLHAHDWITIPAALELRRRTGIPLVLTVHSMEHDRSAGFCPQTWIEDIERSGVHGADRVIAVSRYTKQAVQDHYGVEPSRVVAIHNGIDVAKFRSAGDRDYAEAPGPVLFLSRLSRQKGPLYFLRAAHRVLQRRPDARFVMAGTGEMLGECIEYALEAGIADRVTFTGFVDGEMLADFYAHNGLYVLPSVSEPFGISVLEAMATGLPTIVSRTCGVGEALHHVLRSGYDDTDELARMIVALLDHPVLREAMGRSGAQEAARFTWAACAARTAQVYAELAGREGTPPTLPDAGEDESAPDDADHAGEAQWVPAVVPAVLSASPVVLRVPSVLAPSAGPLPAVLPTALDAVVPAALPSALDAVVPAALPTLPPPGFRSMPPSTPPSTSQDPPRADRPSPPAVPGSVRP